MRTSPKKFWRYFHQIVQRMQKCHPARCRSWREHVPDTRADKKMTVQLAKITTKRDKLLNEKKRLQEELEKHLTLNADMVTANVDHSSEIKRRVSAEKKAAGTLANFPRNTNRVTLGVHKKYVDSTIKAKPEGALRDAM